MSRERIPCRQALQGRRVSDAANLLALLSEADDDFLARARPPRPAASRARAMTVPRRAAPRTCVTAPGRYAGAVSYLAAGGGPRPVVFVHGTPGAADDWVDYLLAVPDGARYLALDRPGFGRSDPGEAVVSLRDQAAAVLAVLDAELATASGPAILVGHSLGAPVVTRAAVDAPTRVAALVLLAGALDPALERVHPAQRLAAWGPLARRLPRPVRNANAELLALQRELADMRPALDRLTTPTFVVHGTRDRLVPFANVEYLERRLRRARTLEVFELEGRNHFLPWHSKPVIDRVVARALARA